MAKIQSSEIIQRAIKDLRLDAARERVPTESSDKIVLTYPLNFQGVNFVKSGAAAGNIFTTSSTKRTFITSIQISSESFEANGAKTDSVSAIALDGSTIILASNRTRTGAALSVTMAYSNFAHSFTYPIELKKGTNVSISRQNDTVQAQVFGYELE